MASLTHRLAQPGRVWCPVRRSALASFMFAVALVFPALLPSARGEAPPSALETSEVDTPAAPTAAAPTAAAPTAAAPTAAAPTAAAPTAAAPTAGAPTAAALARPPARTITQTRIFLMTMGPGESLYAQAGHAALMVAEMQGGQVARSDVYNFGDTDWEDPALPWKFITGSLRFRLDRPGDMFEVARDYGFVQNRDVFVQPLALTPAQVREVAQTLEEGLTPDRREYPYHFVDAICTTKIRDLLDEVLGGTIRAQLESRQDPMTIRDYQRWAFDGYPLAGLGADLLMGRQTDAPISEYRSLFHPDRMRARFMEVTVPDPEGGHAQVPLAGEPTVLAERQGPRLATGRTLGGTWLFGLLGLWLLARGRVVVWPRPHERRGPHAALRALGGWLLVFTAATGLMSLLVVAAMAVTSVPEFRANELLLTLMPLDLWLMWPALRWVRGVKGLERHVQRYALGRVAVAVAVLATHVPGWLVQQPRTPMVFVLAGFALLAFLVSRVQTAAAPATSEV